MSEGTIVIHKVWRSEITGIVVYLVLLAVSILLSDYFPSSVIKGSLFSIGGTSFYLSLPMLWLIPFTWLTMLVARIYNVKYIADAKGLEAYNGILSLSRTITRVRYEDVRGIETDQTIIERLLDIGNVEVSTAASADVDLIMVGVASPKAVQDFIQNERDRRQQIAVNEQVQVSTSPVMMDEVNA